jgi:DNA modification methylase
VTALVLRGDALHLPLADASVDLAIFSPPYWALRSYETGGDARELGSEAHWRDWLANLIAVTAEVARVLKPTGSIFCNLGDKYNSAQSGQNGTGSTTLDPARGPKMYHAARGVVERSAPEKSLLLLPERYRIACVDQLGLTARAVIIQSKRNGLPESVRDRVRRSHEDWVHLTLGPRYYSAIDEIREPHARLWDPAKNGAGPSFAGNLDPRNDPITGKGHRGTPSGPNPLGKLPGSVWETASEPLRIPPVVAKALNLPDHYAAFGTEIVRRLVLGWSPPGVCTACGQGRWPVVEREKHDSTPRRVGVGAGRGSLQENSYGFNAPGDTRASMSATILGYACNCTPWTDHPGTGESTGAHGLPGMDPRTNGSYPQFGQGTPHDNLNARPKVGPWREYHLDRFIPPPSRPAVVLDPFAGTGTTLLVARALGRHAVGVDLSESYCRLARWRIFSSQAASKAQARTWAERQGVLL